jgi:hypothetical protein
MTRLSLWVTTASLTALASAGLAAADDPATTALLKAQRVKSSVHVRVASAAVKEATQAELEYALAEDPTRFFPLLTGTTFVSSRTIKVAYQRLNPLTTQVTSSIAAAEDPSNAALVKFAESMLKIPKIVGGDRQESSRVLDEMLTCPGFESLVGKLRKLADAVREHRTVADDLQNWRNAIDKQPGHAGVSSASNLIADKIKRVEESVKQVRDLLAGIRADAARAGLEAENAQLRQARVEAAGQGAVAGAKPAVEAANPATGARTSGSGSVAARKPESPPAKPGTPPTPAATTKEAAKAKLAQPATETEEAKKAEEARAAEERKLAEQRKATACQLDVVLQRAFVALLDTGDVDARIVELEGLAADLKGLKASLEPYADHRNWDGDSYVFAAVIPAADTIKTLSVKVAPVTLSSVAAEGVVREVGDKKAASGNLIIRQFSTFAPELGAGLVVSSVRRPTYGTTTNDAGQTVVARKDDEDVSLSAAVMLNGVCRCGIDSFAYPMFQVGALADTKSPGILFGGGLRFIRPSQLALSVGAALVWIKDLDTLAIGAPVGGTTDIDNDLKFEPAVKLYFSLQYTF